MAVFFLVPMVSVHFLICCILKSQNSKDRHRRHHHRLSLDLGPFFHNCSLHTHDSTISALDSSNTNSTCPKLKATLKQHRAQSIMSLTSSMRHALFYPLAPTG
ncbi:hypothetical protein BKA80DRAFT_57560 [Phyllosticta citrichinensis]